MFSLCRGGAEHAEDPIKKTMKKTKKTTVVSGRATLAEARRQKDSFVVWLAEFRRSLEDGIRSFDSSLRRCG
jgi:hypothetical protein